VTGGRAARRWWSWTSGSRRCPSRNSSGTRSDKCPLRQFRAAGGSHQNPACLVLNLRHRPNLHMSTHTKTMLTWTVLLSTTRLSAGRRERARVGAAQQLPHLHRGGRLAGANLGPVIHEPAVGPGPGCASATLMRLPREAVTLNCTLLAPPVERLVLCHSPACQLLS